MIVTNTYDTDNTSSSSVPALIVKVFPVCLTLTRTSEDTLTVMALGSLSAAVSNRSVCFDHKLFIKTKAVGLDIPLLHLAVFCLFETEL